MIDRVLVINDLSWPKGGASALAVQSALDLAASGIRVDFLCGDDAGDGPLARGGVAVHALGGARLLERGGAAAALAGLYNPRAATLLARWIERNDTPGTVYHLHGWSQILSPSLFGPLRRVSSRLLISAHDFFFACPNGALYDYAKEAVCQRTPSSLSCLTARCDRRNHAHKLWRSARQLVRLSLMGLGEAPTLLLIHGGMAPHLERAGIPRDRLRVLPNPVTPYANRRIEAEGNRDVLFVGRLEATKGADLALAACRAAGARLTVIGDGAMLDRLRTEYPEMRFAGRLPFDAIAAHAREARLLLMPSRYMEPFGLSAVEALWSGLPVILSESSLLAPDIVAAGAGLAVEPRDTPRFSEAVRALLDDDSCARMSHAAFSRTRHLALTRDAWTKALIAAYRARLSSDPEALDRAERDWLPPLAPNRLHEVAR